MFVQLMLMPREDDANYGFVNARCRLLSIVSNMMLSHTGCCPPNDLKRPINKKHIGAAAAGAAARVHK